MGSYRGSDLGLGRGVGTQRGVRSLAWAGVTGRKRDSSVQMEQPYRSGDGKMSLFLLIAFVFLRERSCQWRESRLF